MLGANYFSFKNAFASITLSNFFMRGTNNAIRQIFFSTQRNRPFPHKAKSDGFIPWLQIHEAV
jgi:hypothetical protein